MAKETARFKKADISRRTFGRGVLPVAAVAALALGLQSRAGAAQTRTTTLFAPGASVSNLIPQPDWSALELGPQVQIVGVVDGDTVELDRGPDVRMVGTQAPKLPLGRAHVDEWPLAQQAKAELEHLIARHGGAAQLYFGGRKVDRHNRHLAHIVLSDGSGDPVWLQGAMVLAGLARVYTFADNRSLIPDLLLREQIARAQHRSVWDHAYYSIRDARDPQALLQRLNHFELVEGVVRNVAAQRARWYLNFGETWREDFTITIDREHDRVFENEQFDIHALQGVPVRVRGWVMEDGGPLIRVDHPEAIERLSAV